MYINGTTGLDTAAVVQNFINRPWTMGDLITFSNSTTQGVKFNLNVKSLWGSSGEAGAYYDGTDLIIDPQLSGSGIVKLGSASDRNITLGKIGLGSSAISSLAWINFINVGSTGRQALNFDFTYTGSSAPANILSTLTFQGSAASPTGISCQLQVSKNQDQTGTANLTALKLFQGTTGTQTITQGTTNLNAILIGRNGSGTAHTGGTVNEYGINIASFGAAYAGVAAFNKWGINSNEDIQVATGIKMLYEGSTTVKGDTYHIYDLATTTLQTWVDGVKVMDATSGLITAYVSTTGFGGAGGGTFKQGTVDFGTSSCPDTKTVTIADASIGASAILCLGITPSAGRDADEMEMEMFSLAYGNIVAATSVDIYVTNTSGGAEGTYLVNYTRN